MKKIVLLLVAVFSLFGLIACVDNTEEEKTLDSIVITAEPTKLEYNLGEELDLAGLAVKAVYSDETEVELAVADLTVTGFDNTTASEQTITVTYEGKTDTFTVNVFDPAAERVLRSISVKSLPTTQQYAIGESFDDTGLVIEALYENGDREEVTEYVLTGYTSDAVKLDGVMTVTFEDKTTTFTYSKRSYRSRCN